MQVIATRRNTRWCMGNGTVHRSLSLFHYTSITLAIPSHLSLVLCTSNREEETNSSSERRGNNVNGGNNLKPSERRETEFKLKRTFALKSWPESGLDSLICATITLQWVTQPADRSGTSPGVSGRGSARAEDAQGTPPQSHISPSILVYEDNSNPGQVWGAEVLAGTHVALFARPLPHRHLVHPHPQET